MRQRIEYVRIKWVVGVSILFVTRHFPGFFSSSLPIAFYEINTFESKIENYLE